jgi:hypothetical protein
MPDPLTTRIPICLCPLCGHSLDSVGSLSDPTAAPSPGDWIVCIGCTAILEFDYQRRLNLVPFAIATRALHEDADLLGTVRAIQAMQRTLGPGPKGRPN